jgi:DNA replication and repair protein RecF
MVIIKRLDITGVRNLRSASLHDLSAINLLYGSNGAGKTSVLESIHLLSSARTFRGHKLKPLINVDMDNCVCFGEIDIPGIGYQPVGVQRFRTKATPSVIKVSGKTVRSASTLAENLPLQTINSDTFQLLDGSPAVRRQFLDWGVFHVEHRFHSVWMGLQRCLKQRNSLLRHGRIDDSQLPIWTQEFVSLAEQLDQFRLAYFDALLPLFEETLGKLIDIKGLEVSYQRGWDADKSLEEVLLASKLREFEQGYTLSGPHRSDIRFRYQGCNAADVLSRGQQKLVVCALRIAQGYLLSQLTGRGCVYLLDDLPAELDKKHRMALCGLLEKLECQVFITCVDQHDMDDCWSNNASIKMFHVEHGNIKTEND